MWPFTNKNKKKKINTIAYKKYAAAQSDRLTADWMATKATVDQEIQNAIGPLRDRARQLERDNDYVRAALRTFEDNVIGEGIGFQAQTKMLRGGALNQDLNDKIEELWCEWTNKINCDVKGESHFEDIERLVVRSLKRDGEVFVRKVRQSFGSSKVPLALEVIESDMLDEHYNVNPSTVNSNYIRMGVEKNKWGRPVAYHFWSKHPSDVPYTTVNQKRIRVPAEDIFHIYVIERAGQTRGVSHLASSMVRLHQVEGFEGATVIQQRAGASLMGIIETPEGELVGDDVEGEQRIYDFEAGAIKMLNSGEKFVVPSLPNTIGNFDPFMRAMLRSVGAGSGVSYESISKDYSQSNYSSTRQSLLDERTYFKIIQKWIIRNFHQALFNDWLETAYLFGAIELPNFMAQKSNYLKVKWQPPRWQWIDPLKEVNAYKEAVRAGFMTQTEVVNQSGGDIDELMTQRKREVELAEENDLYFESNPEYELDPEYTNPNASTSMDSTDSTDNTDSTDTTDTAEEKSMRRNKKNK